MKTTILRIDARNPEPAKVAVAAKTIRDGGLVAFPTETVYGLGANALDAKAVESIYKAKGRPSDNPMIVHIAEKADIFKFTKTAGKTFEIVNKLIERFWPGPLTIVAKKTSAIPGVVTAGMDTVAIRMPRHPVALALIKAAGVPIAAPSANISGRPSPTTARHVVEDLYEKIPVIIDGGDTEIGIESTILDVTSDVPMLLRPGKISVEELISVLGMVDVHPVVKGDATVATARAPGMKYRHYAPSVDLVLVEGEPVTANSAMFELARKYRDNGKKVFLMNLSDKDPTEVAHKLFKEFRDCERRGIDVIIAEGISEKGVGLAVMNRLRKAASKVMKV